MMNYIPAKVAKYKININLFRLCLRLSEADEASNFSGNLFLFFNYFRDRWMKTEIQN